MRMNANTRKLQALGQSLWIDSISRDMLRSGELARLMADCSVTGLTSNPTIFQKAMAEGDAYDRAIANLARTGRTAEEVFFELALDDLREAAALLQPAHARQRGRRRVGLARAPRRCWSTPHRPPRIEARRRAACAGRCHNLFIKIPGTPAGIPAIEESIFRGVPINVTLLFSREQTLAAAQAYMRGDRAPGRDGGRSGRRVGAVAVREPLGRRGTGQGVAAHAQPARHRGGQRTYKAWRELLALGSLEEARGRRRAIRSGLLWASTGTKDPEASPTLYVEALAAPGTIDTMPRARWRPSRRAAGSETRCRSTAATRRP
jgi:transaldolase